MDNNPEKTRDGLKNTIKKLIELQKSYEGVSKVTKYQQE